jgi:dihydroorotate dehydrogenase
LIRRKLQTSYDRPPFYIGAGVIKHETDIADIAQAKYLSAVMLGTYTDKENAGNSQGGQYNVKHREERWDDELSSAWNSVAFENPGRENASRYLPDGIKLLQSEGKLAFISLTALRDENPKVVLPRLALWGREMGANGIQVDGSCQNLDPQHPLICEDVEQTLELGEAVRGETGYDIPIVIKVSAMPEQTIKNHISGGIRKYFDIVEAINSIGNQRSPNNPETDQPRIEVNGGLAGQSGAVIRNKARENLAMWRLYGMDVISIGGIDSTAPENGWEIYTRLQHLGALMVGGAQELVFTDNKAAILQCWAAQYYEFTPNTHVQ